MAEVYCALSPDVQHAQLAAFGEVAGAQLGKGGEGDGFRGRHSVTGDRAVQIHVSQLQ